MPQTITYTKTLYQYDELDDNAQEKARAWLAGLAFSDNNDWEFVYDDADCIAAMLGIEINRRTYKTMGGSTGSEPTIYFSGFSNQGDGACFEGSYSYKKGALKAIKEYAPEDKRLHDIAWRLQNVQSRYFYSLSARVIHRGHYYHSGCMHIEVDANGGAKAVRDGDESEVAGILRDFADWIYRRLEDEYDYQTSDEVVADNIRANEYTFDEHGNREN